MHDIFDKKESNSKKDYTTSNINNKEGKKEVDNNPIQGKTDKDETEFNKNIEYVLVEDSINDSSSPIEFKLAEEDDDDDIETVLIEEYNQPTTAWKDKKSGIDNNEMSSRRINRKKALENEDKQKTSMNNNDGKKVAPKEQIAAGLQKLNTKIKQNVYDDDDEDEKSYIIVGTMNDNSLADALTYDENKALKIKKENDNNKILQNAGKLEAINNAEKLANQAGVKLGAKAADKNIADATYTMDKMGKTLNKDVAKELKIKRAGNIPASKHKDLIKGIKNIKDKGGKVNDMKVNVVAKAANVSDKGVAEIIYQNSSTFDKKKIHKQTDIKTIKEKTGRGTTTSPSKKIKEKGAIKEIEKGNVRLERPQKIR